MAITVGSIGSKNSPFKSVTVQEYMETMEGMIYISFWSTLLYTTVGLLLGPIAFVVLDQLPETPVLGYLALAGSVVSICIGITFATETSLLWRGLPPKTLMKR